MVPTALGTPRPTPMPICILSLRADPPPPLFSTADDDDAVEALILLVAVVVCGEAEFVASKPWLLRVL